MRRAKGMGLLLIAFVVSLQLAPADAQEKKGIGRGNEKGLKAKNGFGITASHSPIDITSDTVEANQKQNTVTFKGNVVAKQEDTTLYANTIVIYHDPSTKKLKEIIAIGNVKIVRLNRRATGQKATFFQDENKVVLEGEAVVREGENVVRGERVIYFIDEERSVMEGSKGKSRVTTRITPPPKE
jgi:lipopolysaccharide export system protein LptA